MTEDDPRLTEQRQQRLDELQAQIAVRLEPVCQGWPTEMFEEMVRGLAALTLKYERHGDSPTYDRRTTDRLLDDMKTLIERSVELRNTPRSGPATPQEQQETD
jgi:hypothetical protein